MNALWIVAGKEFRDGLRNRWVVAVTVGFALFALGIAYFGGAASGHIGFAPLATTLVSLANLAVFVIPLIALLLAYDSIIGEIERGTLWLLLAYPLDRWQLLLGKFLGQAAMLGLATLIGFGVAGLWIGAATDELDQLTLWRAFGFFILSSMVLGWVFIAMAQVVSIISAEKAQAAGLALIVWFVFVLIFDIVLLAVLVASGGAINQTLLSFILLLNPSDVFRLANLAGFESAQALTGLGSLAQMRLFQPGLLLLILFIWLLATLALAMQLFARKRL